MQALSANMHAEHAKFLKFLPLNVELVPNYLQSNIQKTFDVTLYKKKTLCYDVVLYSKINYLENLFVDSTPRS